MAEKDTLDLAALTRKVTTDVMLARINNVIQGKVNAYANEVAHREAQRWYAKNELKMKKLVERQILMTARANRRKTNAFMRSTVMKMCRKAMKSRQMHVEFYE